jgi:phage N-6-adenine-methyltransferase
MDKRTQKLMFSSERQDWATPQDVFDKLNEEFKFTLDPCCSELTKKCKRYYTKETDGLSKDWSGENVFINPPFGREQAAWIKKGYEESLKPNTTIVFLIPARTDTIAFHKYLYGKSEIRFIKGRLTFEKPNSTTPKNKWTKAPFPSMLCILGSQAKLDQTLLCEKIAEELLSQQNKNKDLDDTNNSIICLQNLDKQKQTGSADALIQEKQNNISIETYLNHIQALNIKLVEQKKELEQKHKDFVEKLKGNIMKQGNLANRIIETEDGQFEKKHDYILNEIVCNIIDDLAELESEVGK